LYFIVDRYLIFYDYGYAQYVLPVDIRMVVESARKIWEDVHPHSQEFIREYVQRFPERPMVRLQTGTVVSVEWNG